MNVQKLLESAAEVITETVLVSAYDLHKNIVKYELNFPEFVFLDSGGYESSKDSDFSDLGHVQHEADPTWSKQKLKEVLDKWPYAPPTVLVSYDHRNHRIDLRQQIDQALELFAGRCAAKELLIKPETKDQEFVQVENVIKNIHRLADFDVVGFTEKELGSSPLKRMEAIANVRNAFRKANLNIPMHIFGSLDTLSTPLYFLAGADIFDGLTWLRMAYKDGYAIYLRNYAASVFEPNMKDEIANGRVLIANFLYLQTLQGEMNRFLNKGDFGEFSYHGQLFERVYKDLTVKLGG